MMAMENGRQRTGGAGAGAAPAGAAAKRRWGETGFQSLENGAKPGSNVWKNGESGFQCLENGGGKELR